MSSGIYMKVYRSKHFCLIIVFVFPLCESVNIFFNNNICVSVVWKYEHFCLGSQDRSDA